MFEKIAPTAAMTLTETVLGSAVLLLILLLFFVLKLVFKHMGDAEIRAKQTLSENTKALEKMADSHANSGDKIANSIERALLYSRDNSAG